jgi:iron-sulfur cluster assembly 1
MHRLRPAFFDSVRRGVSAVAEVVKPAKRRIRPLKAPIELTSAAAVRIKEMISGKDDMVGVKIGVKRRGCNGYSYTMNYGSNDDLKSRKYEIAEKDGVSVLVEPSAVFYIAGTVMDWEETELSSEFTFINPNSKGECGCGESFNV